jgi:F-type H+-transporting ATPase subunit epsilon
MASLHFELVSPEKLVFSGDVEQVDVPGAEGDFGVLPGHAPFLSTLRPGVITIYANRTPSDAIFVSGGFAEVTGERCTVLAEEAVRIAEADRAEVEARAREARAAFDAAVEAQEKALAGTRADIAEALLAAIDRGRAA